MKHWPAHPFLLILLHIFCFVVAIICGPIHFVASLFSPLFGKGYQKWVNTWIPSFHDYLKTMLNVG